MQKTYQVYKGLQKPLLYKGFAGKFIYWGIGALLAGLFLGALVMALVNMLVGVMVLAGGIGGGLYYTASRQKKGLHDKTRDSGHFHFSPKINHRNYAKKE